MSKHSELFLAVDTRHKIVSTLLFPGRHLVHTRFQAEYILSLLGHCAGTPQVQTGHKPIEHIVFAISSSNQENSRYTPIPFHARVLGVDRFAQELRRTAEFTYSIVGIPHYGHTVDFASFTLKEVAGQLGKVLVVGDTLVLCSTPEVSRLYAALGFSIAPAEQSVQPMPALPIDLVRTIGESPSPWDQEPKVLANLSPSTYSLFKDFPEIPAQIARIYRDPITTQTGGLTERRNYNVYARGMNDIVGMKYRDIRRAIRAGRIVDEGCADGALLAEIARDFPDSDLYGIDISAEFAARFQERKRSGGFGNVYACFHLRNLLEPVFGPGSIDTTISSGTLHELWSYAGQEKTIRAYLAAKFKQLRPGGRLVIRDVVGPENGDATVLLSCCTTDGVPLPEPPPADRSRKFLQGLSTHGRFKLFARDFLQNRQGEQTRVTFEETPGGFLLPLRTAAEFLSKKDYLDNWCSEMNEEFCFWDYARWRQVLQEAGFYVMESNRQPSAGSRAFVNPWIVKHRYSGSAQLLDPRDPAKSVAYPPTTMVLVAEKPSN